MTCLVPWAGRLPLGRLLAVIATLLALPLSPAVAAGPDVDAVEEDLLARVNAKRALAPALQSHPQLAAAAHAQAAWLASLPATERAGLTGQTGHCGGPGCPDARAAAAGWPDPRTVMGEILQLGGRFSAASPQAANDAAIAAWERSASHRAALHAPGWRFAGVAVVRDITAVVFGERCTVAGCVAGTGTGSLLTASAGSGLPGAPAGPGLPGAPAGTDGGAAGGTAKSDGDGDGAGTATAKGERAADAGGAGASGGASRAGCAPRGRVRVLRRPARRAAVEVHITCKQPGRRYRARVRDGRRKRVVSLARPRTVVALSASRRPRWVRVSVDEGRRSLGAVRVRVRGT